MKNSFLVFPCRVRQGFFVFILMLVAGVFSAPQIGYTIVINGSDCLVRIYGSNAGVVKSGEIVCDYSAQFDIDNALVYSPLSSIIVGASIDRVNHRLKLVINATGKITIDNSEMVDIDLNVPESQQGSILSILGASFTDPQGNKTNASVNPVNVAFRKTSVCRVAKDNLQSYIMLDGRRVSSTRAQQIQAQMLRGYISLRMVRKQ